MGTQKIFLSSVVTLLFFNIAFYIIGLNETLLSAGSIIGYFITLSVIAVIISIIPTTSAGSTITWLMRVVIIVSIIYSVSFNVLTYSLSVGVGLCTQLTNMFSSSVNSLEFIGWLFFTIIGIVGTISGIIAMSGGGEN